MDVREGSDEGWANRRRSVNLFMGRQLGQENSVIVGALMLFLFAPAFSSRESFPHAALEPLIVAAVSAAGSLHGVPHVLLGALLARGGVLAEPRPPPAVDGVSCEVHQP